MKWEMKVDLIVNGQLSPWGQTTLEDPDPTADLLRIPNLNEMLNRMLQTGLLTEKTFRMAIMLMPLTWTRSKR